MINQSLKSESFQTWFGIILSWKLLLLPWLKKPIHICLRYALAFKTISVQVQGSLQSHTVTFMIRNLRLHGNIIWCVQQVHWCSNPSCFQYQLTFLLVSGTLHAFPYLLRFFVTWRKPHWLRRKPPLLSRLIRKSHPAISKLKLVLFLIHLPLQTSLHPHALSQLWDPNNIYVMKTHSQIAHSYLRNYHMTKSIWHLSCHRYVSGIHI